jgi:hypothetical protein
MPVKKTTKTKVVAKTAAKKTAEPVNPRKTTTPVKPKAKNYNYKAAEAKELEANPSALGRVSEAKGKEIEKSLAPKRKAFEQDYNAGKLKKSALKDSIGSTLREGSKVKDFMPVKYKPERKKVRYWIGGSAAKPIVSWNSPQIWPDKPKRKSKK